VLSQGEPRDAAINFDDIVRITIENERFLCTLNTATLSTRTHLADWRASTRAGKKLGFLEQVLGF